MDKQNVGRSPKSVRLAVDGEVGKAASLGGCPPLSDLLAESRSVDDTEEQQGGGTVEQVDGPADGQQHDCCEEL